MNPLAKLITGAVAAGALYYVLKGGKRATDVGDTEPVKQGEGESAPQRATEQEGE